MKKHLSSLFSTLQGGARGGLLILALIASSSLWAYDFKSGDLYYDITSSSAPYTVEVTYEKWSSSSNYAGLTSATIPETVTYNGTTYSVTSIGDYAFRYCSSLSSITIPNSVTSIGDYAFCYCSSLSSITIPNSVTSIGSCAFFDCSSLTSITIPNSVTSIGSSAFYDCSALTSITIPNSVTSIGEYAFNGCSSLSSVVWNVKNYPDSDYSDRPFDDISSQITSFTFGNEVEHIPAYLCSGMDNLTSITIPNSVTSIRYGAFEGCSSLTSVVWNAKNLQDFEYLNANPFYDIRSQITSFTFGNEVEHIPANLCYGMNNLTSITIPNSVTSIGEFAFNGCSSITTPVYNAHCFAYMPTSYKGAYIIPDGIKQIAGGAFSSCSSLTSVTIPNSVTSIGKGAFEACSSLTYLSIPNSVKYAEEDDYENGFSSILNCYNLKTLIAPADFFGVDGDEEDYQDVMEEDFPYLPKKLELITINDGEIHRLAWDMIYASYKTLKTIDLATTTDVTIEEEAFKNCYKLENLMLPSQLEAVPYMAVAECVKLQSITIPATVTEIDDRAFENCRSIKSIIFEGAEPAQSPARHAAASGSALWRIGSWAFYNCHQLEDLTIPEGVTEVGDAAFYGCSYLTDMTLPSTIQSIGDNGFALCAKLQKIYVNALTPPTIQAKTFYDVNRQIPVYVPDEVVDAYKSDPYWKEFNIQGKSNAPTAVENIGAGNKADAQKIMRNGQLLILKDGKTYNVVGQIVE